MMGCLFLGTVAWSLQLYCTHTLYRDPFKDLLVRETEHQEPGLGSQDGSVLSQEVGVDVRVTRGFRSLGLAAVPWWVCRLPCPTPSHLSSSSSQPGSLPLSTASGPNWRARERLLGFSWTARGLVFLFCLNNAQIADLELIQTARPTSCDVRLSFLGAAILAISVALLQQPSRVKTVNKANEPPRPCFSPYGTILLL